MSAAARYWLARPRRAGLAIAWSLWPRDYQPNLTAAPDEHVFNAFLKIGDDGHISAIVPQCEMGQGVTTLLPQIMADELGADWRTIAVETAPINPLYTNTLLVDADSSRLHPARGRPRFRRPTCAAGHAANGRCATR